MSLSYNQISIVSENYLNINYLSDEGKITSLADTKDMSVDVITKIIEKTNSPEFNLKTSSCNIM